jgi:4-hydroxybenzoate polyprenyltransferase
LSGARAALHLRAAALTVEACWWMMRPFFFISAVAVPAGWLAADDPPGEGRLLALTAALALAGGAVNVLNDILDADKDRRTAPELPIPSGLLTLTAATGLLGGLTLAVVGLFALGAPSLARLGAGLAVIGLGVTIVTAYSVLKSERLLAPLAAACAYASLAVTGWLVAGGGGGPIAAVVACTLVFGVARNLLAAVRDVDADRSVGNESLAVRLGAPGTLRLAAALDVAAHACVVAVAAPRAGALALAAIAASLAVTLLAYRRTFGLMRGAANRAQRSRALWSAGLARWTSQFVLVGVLSVPVGLATAAAACLLAALCTPRAYERRLVGGALRRALEANRARRQTAPASLAAIAPRSRTSGSSN